MSEQYVLVDYAGKNALDVGEFYALWEGGTFCDILADHARLVTQDVVQAVIKREARPIDGTSRKGPDPQALGRRVLAWMQAMGKVRCLLYKEHHAPVSLCKPAKEGWSHYTLFTPSPGQGVPEGLTLWVDDQEPARPLNPPGLTESRAVTRLARKLHAQREARSEAERALQAAIQAEREASVALDLERALAWKEASVTLEDAQTWLREHLDWDKPADGGLPSLDDVPMGVIKIALYTLQEEEERKSREERAWSHVRPVLRAAADVIGIPAINATTPEEADALAHRLRSVKDHVDQLDAENQKLRQTLQNATARLARIQQRIEWLTGKTEETKGALDLGEILGTYQAVVDHFDIPLGKVGQLVHLAPKLVQELAQARGRIGQMRENALGTNRALRDALEENDALFARVKELEGGLAALLLKPRE